MKTVVITLSKAFLKSHPRAGELTGFKDKFLSKEKKHTIRFHSSHWIKNINKILHEEAVLSVREWSGKPYGSKQSEIDSLPEVGLELLNIDNDGKFYIGARRKSLSNEELTVLAKNDGLSLKDFLDWFEVDKLIKEKRTFIGIIIHFTKMRYNEK